MNIISTWVYCTPPGDKVLHSQTGRDADLPEIQAYYWRCAFSLFESSTRLNSDTRHILFVNQDPPTQLDHLATSALIAAFNIEIVTLPTFTRPPKDYYLAWNTQFIILDILDWLTHHTSPADLVYILDCDCIFHRPISTDMELKARECQSLLYTIGYPHDSKVNGLTLDELRDISNQLDPQAHLDRFVYNGGEFLCLRANQLSRFSDQARSVYRACLDRHQDQLLKFNEEAQLLSFVEDQMGYPPKTANAYIKRIWCNRYNYANIDGSEDDLILWHLPDQKGTGFLRRYRSICLQAGGYRAANLDDHTVFALSESVFERFRFTVFSLARSIYRSFKKL